MTRIQIPPRPDDPGDPGEVRADALTLLRSVRRTLADLLDDLRDGGPTSPRDVALKHADLESALRRAFETEGKWNDYQAKQADQGSATDPTLDLDAARREVGCRLARIRSCCQEP